MARLLTGSIDVTKIVKEKLFKGKKGTYLNVSIWIEDSEDQYGNIASVQQQTRKGEPKIYLGNLKEYSPNIDKPTTEENPEVENPF